MRPKPIHSEGGEKTFALVFEEQVEMLSLVGDVASLEGEPRLCVHEVAVVVAAPPLRSKSELTTSLEEVIIQCGSGPTV